MAPLNHFAALRQIDADFHHRSHCVSGGSRKPLILVRAAILDLLLRTIIDPRRDREVFLKLLTIWSPPRTGHGGACAALGPLTSWS